ncbi:AAA family ATPase, partial [Aeromicrobium sp.]|uniref:AAA family ATPase n=1 Tax=Aeromicrobium sp. TaxID=1871063 RepID=UPI0028A8E8AD
MERSWPLTGRDEERRRIVEAIRPTAAGIVVAGSAGVGKTRLAREALSAACAQDASIVWALGSAAARSVPLGAFAGAFEGSVGDGAGTVARALDQLRRRRPRVLVVDDAHQLDEHSALVLHRVVVRRLAPVLVTLRRGEPAPDTVTALWKDDLLPRLDLGPLDADQVATLVARVLGGPVESASARRLWRLAEGSPLFLRHVLVGEVAAGRFTPSSGVWCWTSEPRITPELTELLEHEIGDLAPDVREVVDVVTLAEPVSLTTLVALTSSAAVEQSEDRGLVRMDGDLVRLAHPLYGEVRRNAMGTLRARRLRGRIATTLDDADPIPRAVLSLDSDLEPDPVVFLRAAEAATRLYDLPLAERLARAAAAGGDPTARRVHAATLSWLSRGVEAETILVDQAASATDDASRAMAHLLRSGNLLFTMARPDAARQALDQAAATGAYPDHVAAMSLALAAATGDLRTVLDDGPTVLRAELPDDLARILVASAISAAGAVTGDAALLDEAAVVGGLTAEHVPTVIPGFGLADFQVLGRRLIGEPTRGAELAERMRAASDELPGPARLMGLVVAGHAALGCGRLHDAVPLLSEAWAGLADSGHEFRFRCRSLLAMALAQAGQPERAKTSVATERHPAYTLFGPDDVLARAWGAAAEGSTTEAIGHAVAAAELARNLG